MLENEVAIDVVQHSKGVLLRFVKGGVGSVALLPEKLRCSQEEPWPKLPANRVSPLIEQHRQIAMALNPSRHRFTDDRFRRWPNNDRLGQLLASRMRDQRQLGTESLDMLGFLEKERVGNEERKVRIRMSRRRGGAIAMRIEHAAVSFDGRPALRDAELVIQNGERVGSSDRTARGRPCCYRS